MADGGTWKWAQHEAPYEKTPGVIIIIVIMIIRFLGELWGALVHTAPSSMMASGVLAQLLVSRSALKGNSAASRPLLTARWKSQREQSLECHMLAGEETNTFLTPLTPPSSPLMPQSFPFALYWSISIPELY